MLTQRFAIFSEKRVLKKKKFTFLLKKTKKIFKIYPKWLEVVAPFFSGPLFCTQNVLSFFFRVSILKKKRSRLVTSRPQEDMSAILF